jgi:hypothetical protein
MHSCIVSSKHVYAFVRKARKKQSTMSAFSKRFTHKPAGVPFERTYVRYTTLASNWHHNKKKGNRLRTVMHKTHRRHWVLLWIVLCLDIYRAASAASTMISIGGSDVSRDDVQMAVTWVIPVFLTTLTTACICSATLWRMTRAPHVYGCYLVHVYDVIYYLTSMIAIMAVVNFDMRRVSANIIVIGVVCALLCRHIAVSFAQEARQSRTGGTAD